MAMRRAVVVAAVLAASACGTTVPVADRGASPSAGVGAPAGGGTSAGLAPGGTGSQSASVAGPAPSAAGSGSAGQPEAAAGSAGGAGSAAGPAAGASSAGGRSGVTATGSVSAPGGRGTRAPIQLGILYAVNDGAQSAGVNNGNTVTLQQAVEDFVASYNSSGGIGGRHIVPVYAQMHSASTDYESEIQSACATFTQDHHVAAVLSSIGYVSENLLACLNQAGIPLFSGDYAGLDSVDAQRYPLAVDPDTLIGDTREIDLVEHLSDAGYLTPGSRIGVIVEGCPIDQRIYQDSLVPALSRKGLDLAATGQVRCFQSLSDFGGDASDLQSVVVQFRSKGVDTVMFVSQAAEANLALLFMEAADAQRYLPKYALTSLAIPTVLALNAPADQLANVHGLGWIPLFDSADPNQTRPTSVGATCLKRVRAQGLQPQSSTDYAYVDLVCDMFNLYDAALRATGGDSTAQVVLRALPAVTRTYSTAATLGGGVAPGPGGRPVPGEGCIFGWVGGRFVYTGAPFSL